MLLERLYQTSQVPTGTSVHHAKQLRNELFDRLMIRIDTKFQWYAVCTVAVEAGFVAANRKIKQRCRLRDLVDILSSYIGEDSPCRDFPEEWELTNMVFGYGACLDYPKNHEVEFFRNLLGKISVS